MTEIIGQTHGEERAFYGRRDISLKCCTFSGEEDGESALKECENVKIDGCDFYLRYPLWHVKSCDMKNSVMYEGCRAALWYCNGVRITSSELGGIKALRECDDVSISDSKIASAEFGWKTRGFTATNTSFEGEYIFLDSSDIVLEGINLKGKYSFQYVENAVIKNSVLDTKDAFWHGKNITVYDSVVKGEYLGWYSENLRLIRCRVIGTQPLCYAKGLVLEDCETEGCDLSFEKSEVNADLRGSIVSIKNPSRGVIKVDRVGEIVSDGEGEKITRLELSSGVTYI